MGTIAQEITRIEGAKADLKTAIEAKGVTVPSATLIDGYAALVASIPSGGGGGTKILVNPDVSDYSGDTSFSGVKLITDINWPSGITDITVSAFENCEGLTSVTIPSSVTHIYGRAFEGCTGLTSFTIGSSVEFIGTECFKNDIRLTSITIPNSVTSIGINAFYHCTGLTSMTIPSTVEYLGGSAFYECVNIEEITFNCNLQENQSGFAAKRITLGSTVTSIGDDALSDNSNLDGITVNATTPPLVGTSSFNRTAMCPIYVPAASLSAYQNDENWSYFANRIVAQGTSESFVTSELRYNTQTGSTPFTTISDTVLNTSNVNVTDYLERVRIGDSVEEIGTSTFMLAQNLSKIIFSPNSTLTTLGDTAIETCPNLLELELPDSLQTIGDYGVSNNSSLRKLTIGSGIETIGQGAFSNNGDLYVTIKATTPPTISDPIFDGSNLQRIYVPNGSLSAYQNDEYWGQYYYDYLEELPSE